VPRRSTVRLLLLGVLIVTTSTQPVFLVGAAFFQIGPEFGLGPLGLGFLTAAFFLTSSVSSPILGRWVQRVGWRRAMTINCLTSSALMMATAFLARSVWHLGALLIASAAVYGMSNPAANQALALHTDPNRAATVFGLKHAGIPSSTLLAGLAVPALVVNSGWRAAFIASSVMAAAVWFLIPRIERSESESFRAAPRRGKPLDRALIRLLATAAGLASLAATALGTYMVSAAVDASFSEVAAGYLQFGGSLMSILARMLVGVLVDRKKAPGFVGLFTLMAIGSLAFVALSSTAGAMFAAMTILAYGTGWAWPGLMTFTVVDANRGSAAKSSSIMQAGVFVGAGAGPIVVGAAVERWGFDAAFLLVAACLMSAALLVRWVQVAAFARADQSEASESSAESSESSTESDESSAV
jgi:MFS family permease